MFVDREQELAWLQEGWDARSPQFRIVYGRRRVGKSRLIDHFAQGTRRIVYQAVEGTIPDQLRDLTEAVLACEENPVLRAAPLINWAQAFATFAAMAQSGPLLVVLDEFQYAAEADPTLASVLQRWWSRDVGDLPIYLILCGSYIRFFVQNVLAGPAYGRNTGSWKLTPLGYRQAAEFFPEWSHEDQLRAYAVLGGVPHYALQFDPAKPLDWNITNNILRRGSVLYQEAELLVREELREPRVYFSILRAISDGCTRLNEIEQRVGVRGLTQYLRNLDELGLATYREPVLGKRRRGVWTVTDPYLRFWFRFVFPYQSQIEHGANPDRVYREIVAPSLDHFVSKPTFEEICRSWVMDRADAGAFPGVTQVGAWWGPVPSPRSGNPLNQAEGEIEVMAVASDVLRLAGEAKWTQALIGFSVLNHLRETVIHVPGADVSTQLYLFGRDFDPNLEAAAKAEGVRLVRTSDLYQSATQR